MAYSEDNDQAAAVNFKTFRARVAHTALAVTATSGRTSVDSQYDVVRLVNEGPDKLFFKFTTSAGTAATTDHVLLAGASETFRRVPGTDTHVAAICATGKTATLYASSGDGN